MNEVNSGEDACSTMIINIAIAVGVMIVSCILGKKEERK